MSAGPADRVPGVARRAARVVPAVWFPLAGVVTALGLIGFAHSFGLVGLALVYVGSAAFGTMMLYAALADGGGYDVPVIRIGLGGGLILVVVLGVLSIFPVGGWFAIAAMAVTCPLVTNRLAPPRTDAASEQARVDATFRQLVARMEQDESRETDGT